MDIPRCNISSVTHLQRGSAKWWKDVEWPVNIFAPLTTPSSKAVHAWWRKREKRLKWHPFVPRSLGQIPRCVLCIPTNEDINLNLSDCLVSFRRLVKKKKKNPFTLLEVVLLKKNNLSKFDDLFYPRYYSNISLLEFLRLIRGRSVLKLIRRNVIVCPRKRAHFRLQLKI